MTDNLGATEKELVENRLLKLETLRSQGVDPYPSKSGRTKLTTDVRKDKDKLIADKANVTVAGRLMAKRGHGKLIFGDIEDIAGKIQVVFKINILGEKFDQISLFEVGDFIEVSGTVFVTAAGELTVEAEGIKILAKTIRPIPEKWYGIKDEELRFRKRYLDFILEPEMRDLFIKKAKFWQSIRGFLVGKGFLEVETPVLESTAGGADANPFTTHHHAFDMDVYLRISTGELWQKRLMVAGFEKTFEIGRQFRNEGVSREHLQDYSQVEYYWAYADYEDNMKLVCEMYRFVAKETFGTTKFQINDFGIDLADDWPRLDYVETVKEKLNIDVLEAPEDEIRAKLKELKIDFRSNERRGRLIDALWKHVRKTIAGPAFLINHPVEVSPLAKRKADDPRLVERFQPIIAGSEIGNGYSELNDPADQRARFEEQAKMRAEGDSEAQMFDGEFVEALEYGMPPTTGFGTSERMFAFLAGKTVREAQIFPLMKPEQSKVAPKMDNELSK